MSMVRAHVDAVNLGRAIRVRLPVEPQLASYLRIEEHKLDVGGGSWPPDDLIGRLAQGGRQVPGGASLESWAMS